MDYVQQLTQAQSFFYQQNYLVCGQLCGSMLEQALRHIYQQLLQRLTLNELQSLRLEASKSGSKKPDELGLGQLLGLYQQYRLWPFLQTHFGIPAQKIQDLPLNFVVQLRNRIAHQHYTPRKSESLLALATLEEFLVLSQLMAEPTEMEWSQSYSNTQIYADILTLLAPSTRQQTLIAQKLDDIAIKLNLTLAELRQLADTPSIQAPAASQTMNQSYAHWLRRSKSAVQYAERFFAQLKQGAPDLQIDFSQAESIQFCTKGLAWMHLVPSIQGFIVYLPDPGFVPPGPSAWFLQCQKVLQSLSLDWMDVYSKIEWDAHFDHGQHPLKLVLPVDLLTEAHLLEVLFDNYNLFCDSFPHNTINSSESS